MWPQSACHQQDIRAQTQMDNIRATTKSGMRLEELVVYHISVAASHVQGNAPLSRHCNPNNSIIHLVEPSTSQMCLHMILRLNALPVHEYSLPPDAKSSYLAMTST